MSNGGVSLLLFHAIVNDGGSVTHFSHDVDLGLHDALPNLYALCLAEPLPGDRRRVTAAAFIKTTHDHGQADFDASMFGVLSGIPALSERCTSNSKLLPARLSLPPGPPLTENEMLKVLGTQLLKLSSAGSA